MKSVSSGHIIDYVSENHTRFSTEIVLRQPTFFTSDYELLSKMDGRENWVIIGEGTTGKVYKARWMGVDVAVKVTDEISLEQPLVEEFVINYHVRHPYIVSFFMASPNYIVMEYMENGTISEALRTTVSRGPDNKPCGPSTEMRRRWCSQIAMGVRYLHESGIVHSDIKPDNVMLDMVWNTKICDVGGGYFVDDSSKDKTYTDKYLPICSYAEESGKHIGKETDMYAVSVMILCIMCWEVDIFKLLGLIDFERRISIPDVSKKEVIEECLHICVPRAYELIQQFDCSDEAKCFIFDMFSWPCRNFITNTEHVELIDSNREKIKNITIECLEDL